MIVVQTFLVALLLIAWPFAFWLESRNEKPDYRWTMIVMGYVTLFYSGIIAIISFWIR